jgi:hypothetical protein
MLQRMLDYLPTAADDRPRVVTHVMAWSYALMNLAALLGNGAFVLLRVTAASLDLSNRLLLASTVVILGVGTGLLVAGVAVPLIKRPDVLRPPKRALRSETHVTWWRTISILLGDPVLWRFVGVCTLLLGVRTIFRHLDVTLPEIMQRLEGPDALFPVVQGANAGLCIVLAPLVQWRLAHCADYTLLVIGSAVSTASLLIVVLAGGTFWPSLAFVCVFSVGEVIWSARFSAYVLRTAPATQRMTYVVLGSLPALLAKGATTALSNALVDWYCPETPVGAFCDAQMVWLGVLGMSLVTPLGLLLGWRWLAPQPLTPPPPGPGGGFLPGGA